ncbi:hypothetical protein GINT2_001301 [Glugoides intestinalis]
MSDGADVNSSNQNKSESNSTDKTKGLLTMILFFILMGCMGVAYYFEEIETYRNIFLYSFIALVVIQLILIGVLVKDGIADKSIFALNCVVAAITTFAIVWFLRMGEEEKKGSESTK